MILKHAAPMLFALVAGASAWAIHAQPRDPGYPSRPVRLVVPLGPGSGPDIRARQLGAKLSEQWGQPVVVENRPGAGGQIAMEHVARAAPDGYTLALAGQSTLAIAPHLTRQPFDVFRDFVPVSHMGTGAILLVVSPLLPVKSVRELIEYAKRHPGKLNAASWGNATVTHLSLELFNRSTGARIAHVPYKGGFGQYVGDLLNGQVQVAFEFYPSMAPHLASGRLRALAVSGPSRIRPLPGVPTFDEAGVPEMTPVMGWQGVAVPAGTPREVVEKLGAAVARALAAPEIRESYVEAGFHPGGSTPDDFAALIRAEHGRWGKLIAEAGIRPE